MSMAMISDSACFTASSGSSGGAPLIWINHQTELIQITSKSPEMILAGASTRGHYAHPHTKVEGLMPETPTASDLEKAHLILSEFGLLIGPAGE